MRQTVDQHIVGLQRNIKHYAAKLHEMTGPEYCPPNACCPSCVWGGRLEDVLEALNRREEMLAVLLCRKAGLKPRKMRVVHDERRKQCPSCNCSNSYHYAARLPGKGRKTVASFGPCRECVGEERRDCPGRGVCHTCRGSGYVTEKMPRLVILRPWPSGYDPSARHDDIRNMQLVEKVVSIGQGTINLEAVRKLDIYKD